MPVHPARLPVRRGHWLIYGASGLPTEANHSVGLVEPGDVERNRRRCGSEPEQEHAEEERVQPASAAPAQLDLRRAPHFLDEPGSLASLSRVRSGPRSVLYLARSFVHVAVRRADEVQETLIGRDIAVI